MLHVLTKIKKTFKINNREEEKYNIYNKRFLHRHWLLILPKNQNNAFYEKDSSNYHHSKSRPQVEILLYRGCNPYIKGG